MILFITCYVYLYIHYTCTYICICILYMYKKDELNNLLLCSNSNRVRVNESMPVDSSKYHIEKGSIIRPHFTIQ